MKLAQEDLERLLVAKELLDRVRFHPAERPDRITLARQILASHDAAELVAAGICSNLGTLPRGDRAYLMDYVAEIKKQHPERDVIGAGYMRQLNEVRKQVKHFGLFPEPQQWFGVGQNTWNYLAQWCQTYLSLALEELNEIELIDDAEVKQTYKEAVGAYDEKRYRNSLESLGVALHKAFSKNQSLRNLDIGTPNAQDAIKLATFGVNANDFLTLQSFLPRIVRDKGDSWKTKWDIEEYGHPGNWRPDAVEFCLRTFLNVVLRIQHAEWIPGALKFAWLYEHKITALKDGVQITQERRRELLGPSEQEVVRTLNRGESVRGHVKVNRPGLAETLYSKRGKTTVSIANFEEKLRGEVDAELVRISCVPRDDKWVRENFEDLPEMPYPEE